MLLEAARDFDISLAHSWMIGDMLSDTIAGKNAGCKGSILIKTASFRPEYETHSSVDFVVDKLSSVNDIILQN
jgi:D-glycero-D-manno-heptose 1,7-bisphosphate phosphatase